MSQRFKYFFSILFIICIFQLSTSCKKVSQDDENTTTSTETSEVEKLTKKDIEGIEYTDYALSDSAESATQDWVAFQEISKQIDFLKQGDLSFFKDDKDVLRSNLADLKSNIPEKLNETAIEVRLIALETNMLKLEGFAILDKSKKDDVINAIRDVLLSYTNLTFQINRKLEKDAQRIQKPN